MSPSPIPVAPYTGAWIEIYHEISYRTLYDVAPYTGAWIEIIYPKEPT